MPCPCSTATGGSDETVTRLDEGGDHFPVDAFAIQIDADPALVADVRGYEEQCGIGVDEGGLLAVFAFEP